MPTDVVKKINSPSTPDYTTLAGWFAGCPANLVTSTLNGSSDGNRWIGECYDNGKFTAAVNITGITVDATRYPILRCAAGQSFSDKAGVRSTALNYSSTTGNGAAVEVASVAYPIDVNTQYTQIIGLQIKGVTYGSAIRLNVANATVKNCIITTGSNSTNLFRDKDSVAATWINCLFIWNSNSGTAGLMHGTMYNCTIVNANATPGSSTAINFEYGQGIIKNCAIFGFGTFNTGTPHAGSDYNATDKASAITGSNNKVNLTYSVQFVSVSNDFRAQSQTSGVGLHAGTPDSTNSPTDISVFTRDATTPYIGAWEAAAASISFTVTPSTIPASHGGNMTLTIVGTGTTLVNGSTVTRTNSVTGSTNVTLGAWARTDNTHATQVVTTAAGVGTWKLTIDGTDSPVLSTANATLAVSLTSGIINTAPSVTLTGTNALWTQETASTLFTVAGVAGCSISSIVVTGDTSATATLTLGSTTGTLTITDASTGATTTYNVNTVSGGITITTPKARQTYQRNGSNQANIPISGTYTGGPGTLTIEASFNGGSYATIATGSGGTFSGTLSNQTAGQGVLTVRFVNATGIFATQAKVGIGDVFLLAGQSNCVGHLFNQQHYVHATLSASEFNWTDTTWADGNDPFFSNNVDGSPWPLLATLHMADQGVPVAFIQTAIGGRSLDNGTPNPYFFSKYNPATGAAGAGYTQITTCLTASGVNSVKAVIWYQGENDSDGNVLQASYAGSLMKLEDNLNADVAGTPLMVPIQLGYGSGGGTIDAIRLGISEACKIGTKFYGMPAFYDFSNALHLTSDSDGQNAAARVWAVLKSELFGGVAGAGHGPRVVACQYDAARTNILVSFDKDLKTGLTFNATVWGVTGNGSGATINSIAYHSTDTKTLVLALSAPAALPILVSFGLGGSTAGKVVPLGPDFTLPAAMPTTTINLPAEPFKNMQAASEGVSSGSISGARLIGASSLVN